MGVDLGLPARVWVNNGCKLSPDPVGKNGDRDIKTLKD
jgi:hypothetical protein